MNSFPMATGRARCSRGWSCAAELQLLLPNIPALLVSGGQIKVWAEPRSKGRLAFRTQRSARPSEQGSGSGLAAASSARSSHLCVHVLLCPAEGKHPAIDDVVGSPGGYAGLSQGRLNHPRNKELRSPPPRPRRRPQIRVN